MSSSEEEDEEFEQAFGGYTRISQPCRDSIHHIKENNGSLVELFLVEGLHFSELAWRLLGRYIANNTHLERLIINGCLENQIMSLFTISRSLKEFDISDNTIGIEGVQNIVPFLQNSPNLKRLYLGDNRNFNSECFGVLIRGLNGKSLEKLYLRNCNITDISALDRYSLPNLKSLNLSGNHIGREGCTTLSNLIQKEGTRLEDLTLDATDIDDEGAELLATSLKHNTKLKALSLQRNFNINDRGRRAFLKILVDVASIESTYNSNHTLSGLYFTYNTAILEHIDSVTQLNRLRLSSRQIGRVKVIKYQLNNQMRKELCRLQGIEYCSIGSLFADIEPIVLPNILVSIGEMNNQSELYNALVSTAPDLMSFVDKKAMIKDSMAKHAAKIKEHTAAYDELNRRLTLIELGDSKQAIVDGDNEGGSGEKRQRTS